MCVCLVLLCDLEFCLDTGTFALIFDEYTCARLYGRGSPVRPEVERVLQQRLQQRRGDPVAGDPLLVVASRCAGQRELKRPFFNDCCTLPHTRKQLPNAPV